MPVIAPTGITTITPTTPLLQLRIVVGMTRRMQPRQLRESEGSTALVTLLTRRKQSRTACGTRDRLVCPMGVAMLVEALDRISMAQLGQLASKQVGASASETNSSLIAVGSPSGLRQLRSETWVGCYHLTRTTRHRKARNVSHCLLFNSIWDKTLQHWHF